MYLDKVLNWLIAFVALYQPTHSIAHHKHYVNTILYIIMYLSTDYTIQQIRIVAPNTEYLPLKDCSYTIISI